MKATIEIELEMAGGYKPERDNELIIDAILESLDGMWFIGNNDVDIISKSATCTLED